MEPHGQLIFRFTDVWGRSPFSDEVPAIKALVVLSSSETSGTGRLISTGGCVFRLPEGFLTSSVGRFSAYRLAHGGGGACSEGGDRRHHHPASHLQMISLPGRTNRGRARPHLELPTAGIYLAIIVANSGLKPAEFPSEDLYLRLSTGFHAN
jgi:hypothetical protein